MQQDKYIKNLLEQLNSGRMPTPYFVSRKLSERVQLARIWSSEENNAPIDIYLLKEKETYMGAVHEQNTELYAYTAPFYRRKGIMKTALKDIVLPHLLQKMPIVRLTISRSLLNEKMYVAGKQLAIISGFEILKEEIGQCRLLLDGTKLQKRIFIQGENVPLSMEEKSCLKSLVHKSALHMSIAQCMMEYREGRSPLSEDLLDTQKKLQYLETRVS